MKKETLNLNNDYSELVAQCVQLLKQPGTVLLLPTETVYGLVCRWTDENARKRIYSLKGRDENKPFQMMLSTTEQLKAIDVALFSSAQKE